jgi:polysaccharide deacetylase family protein (PEP-CTERM system associated)
MPGVLNALTIDVEDYFMVSAFSGFVEMDTWYRYESRVVSNTLRVLDILEEYGFKGTFFVIGWVAENYPEIVKEIDRRGHEIGCHSYSHRLIYSLGADEFAIDTRKAKSIIENVIGKEIYGYRAPSYSITETNMWALEVLAEEGFRYDSSIFPIHHDRYGYPGFHRFPVWMDAGGSGGILEIPMSTIRVLGKNIPVGGGGYLRFYPLAITEWSIRHLNEKEGKSAIVYVHPWEIDPAQPRLNGRTISMLRHYMNLDKTEGRLISLLRSFEFGAVRDVFAEFLSRPISTQEVNNCAF